MKHYLITLQTRDGEFEYHSKHLLPFEGDTTDHLMVLSGLFGEELTYCDWSGGYQIQDDYRLYSLYHMREVEPEHLSTLTQYL